MASGVGLPMRRLLLACGPMNLGFLAVFAPPSVAVRHAIRFPEPPPAVTWVLAV